MSRTAAQAADTSSGVKVVAGMVFVMVMALVVLLLVRARPGPDPFDPRSGRADGALGLVLTLGQLGADVVDTREVPGVGEPTRVLLLEDRLDDQQRDRLLDFVESGGVAIVADPGSTLHGGSGLDGGATPIAGGSITDRRLAPEVERNLATGDCNIASLSPLRGLLVPDGILFPVGPDEPQCFTRESESFVIARQVGQGTIIGLGDNEVFVNEYLRRADNAGLAAALLVPERGADVTFLLGRGANPTVADVGSGDDTLLDLVAPWVWMALALGGVAFVVFAISRSARVGRIVSEPVTVPIAGSELVSATGNLMARAGHASHAGWLILSQLHRDLSRHHNVAPNAPLDVLDRAVAERAGTTPGDVERLLLTTVDDDAALLELSQLVDHLRRTVFDQPITDRPTNQPERVSSL